MRELKPCPMVGRDLRKSERTLAYFIRGKTGHHASKLAYSAEPRCGLIRRFKDVPCVESIMKTALQLALVGSLFALLVPRSLGQEFEQETIRLASQSLKEIMAIPAKGIPEGLLADAQGIAIVPAMINGGLIVGAQHGYGVVLTRDEGGTWKAPTFVTVTGGSVGWQAGLQSTDLILVFRNRRGVESLLRGKVKFGVDASVAAGPVGRQASAATDTALKAEILSWSRSRGLFAGIALEGAVVAVDRKSNDTYYAPRPGEAPGIPPGARRLTEEVATYANPKGTAPVTPAMQAAETEMFRKQLVESSRRLQTKLDDAWQKHLALPAEVYNGPNPPSREVVAQTVARFRAVAAEARYQDLQARPEFQETIALLVRYQNALQMTSATSGSIPLPPPPP